MKNEPNYRFIRSFGQSVIRSFGHSVARRPSNGRGVTCPLKACLLAWRQVKFPTTLQQGMSNFILHKKINFSSAFKKTWWWCLVNDKLVSRSAIGTTQRLKAFRIQLCDPAAILSSNHCATVAFVGHQGGWFRSDDKKNSLRISIFVGAQTGEK